MAKYLGLNLTSIGWVRNPDGSQGYSLSPLTGCLAGCPYCYARYLSHGRMKNRYLHGHNIAAPDTRPWAVTDADPFSVRIWQDRVETLYELARVEKPMGIFLCDMSDLVAPWVPLTWKLEILDGVRACPQHRFYVLTKCYSNMVEVDFPENVWPGMTATTQTQFNHAIRWLYEMRTRFNRKYEVQILNMEPMLEALDPWQYGNPARMEGVDWAIVGAASGTVKQLQRTSDQYPDLDWIAKPGKAGKYTLQPKVEWLRTLTSFFMAKRIPYFLKGELSLNEGLTRSSIERGQTMPAVGRKETNE